MKLKVTMKGIPKNPTAIAFDPRRIIRPHGGPTHSLQTVRRLGGVMLRVGLLNLRRLLSKVATWFNTLVKQRTKVHHVEVECQVPARVYAASSILCRLTNPV